MKICSAADCSAPYTDLSMCRLFCFSLTYAQLSRMFGALQARCSTAQGGRAREAGSGTLGNRISKRISPERAEQASVSPFQGSSWTSSRPRVSAAARPSPWALLPRAFSAGSSYLDLYALNGDSRMFKNTEIRVRSRACGRPCIVAQYRRKGASKLAHSKAVPFRSPSFCLGEHK
jgi:hypothetical protein